jgi:hypothetical protein
MGFQRVVKPRIFVDMLSYLHATGHSEYFDRHENDYDLSQGQGIVSGTIADLLYSNPQSLLNFTLDGGSKTIFQIRDRDTDKYYPSMKYDTIAILNHNLKGTKFRFDKKDANDNIISSSTIFHENTVNFDVGDDKNSTPYNGFSFGMATNKHNLKDIARINFFFPTDTDNSGDRFIGTLFIGNSYTFPHNPNLSMTVSKTFDGIRSSKTKGGHTTSNIDFIGNPDWSGHNAWELWEAEETKLNLGRLGRRSWKLTFDLVSESDVFGALEQSNILPFTSTDAYPDGSGDTFAGYDNPMLEDSNFINSVWIPTLGGTIPMLVQLDDSHNRPDNFAIVTIKQNSLNVTPKAPNLYTFSMTLEETW